MFILLLQTDSLIPAVLIASLTLFLEIPLFQILHSAPLDINARTYILADNLFLALGRLGPGRSYPKTKIAFAMS
jgi:hypothetical protein